MFSHQSRQNWLVGQLLCGSVLIPCLDSFRHRFSPIWTEFEFFENFLKFPWIPFSFPSQFDDPLVSSRISTQLKRVKSKVKGWVHSSIMVSRTTLKCVFFILVNQRYHLICLLCIEPQSRGPCALCRCSQRPGAFDGSRVIRLSHFGFPFLQSLSLASPKMDLFGWLSCCDLILSPQVSWSALLFNLLTWALKT